MYRDVADEVLDKVRDKDYFNGEIDGEIGEIGYTLRTTLLIYQHDGEVYKVLPLYWEMSTYDEEGDEVENDFLFSDLLKYINQ